jgi:hypothetical protein
MAKRFNTNVAALLLDFQMLGRSDQSMFIEAMNQYLFAAPKSRRALVEHWSQICNDNIHMKAPSTRVH